MSGAPFQMLLGGSPGKLSLSYIGFQKNIVSNTTFTFSYTFSAANSDRYLVAAIAWESGSATPTVTIGGVSATPIGTTGTGAASVNSALFYAKVPTNGTQTVVVTFTASCPQIGAALYDLEGVGVLNASNTVVSGSHLAATLNAPAGAAVLAYEFANGTGPTHSWSGVVLDATNSVFSSAWSFSTASANLAAANPSLSVADTTASATNWYGGVCLFSP